MSVITIESKAFKMIMDRLERLDTVISMMAQRSTGSKYMSEQEVMKITGLSRNSLYRKRKSGVIQSATATGRKIQYLRADVEKYIKGDV